MRQTWNREEREKQKALLCALYADYHAPRHDAFVARYNADLDTLQTATWMLRRGIITEDQYRGRIAGIPANWESVHNA
jgi:hypothetical protein